MSSSRHKIAAPNGTAPEEGDEAPRRLSEAELELIDLIGYYFAKKRISEIAKKEDIDEEV